MAPNWIVLLKFQVQFCDYYFFLFDLTVFVCLFRSQCIDNGHNLQALHFAIQLAKYVSDEKHSPHVTEVKAVLSAKYQYTLTNICVI